jgi:hypothetical protein
MEVELKKSKITKSIVDQSLIGSYSIFYNQEGYDVLGWCFIKNLRYVLLYKRLTNQIIKLPYVVHISDIKFYKERTQKGSSDGGYTFPEIYYLKAYCSDFRNTIPILIQNTETDEQMETYHKNVTMFVTLVNLKGQIYL